MALTKNVNGKQIKMTAAEEKAIRAEWKKNLKETIARDAEAERDQKIRDEMERIAREQAIANLQDHDEI